MLTSSRGAGVGRAFGARGGAIRTRPIQLAYLSVGDDEVREAMRLVSE